MNTLRTIFEFILGWTRDVAELRTTYKHHRQDYQ